MTTPARARAAPDVVVIGGGIVGVAAAAHLAEAGRSVVVIERTAIGAGASGRNSGVVQHPFDPVLVDLHLATVTRYRELTERVQDGFRLPDRPAGLLNVTPDAPAAERLTAALAVAYPGLRPTYLTPDEARAIEPGLAPGIAACRLEIGYPVGPALATGAYAAHARALGVGVRLGHAATPWLEAGRAVGVRLDDGTTVAARDVVVAAGPWSAALIDPSGRWRPIRALWGVVVAVELDDPPRHVLEEAEIESEIEPGATGTGEGTPTDVAGHAFSLVTADGTSSLGSTFLDDEPDAAARVAAIVARGARFVPAIGRARIGAHRACARPLSLDGRPLIGRVPGIDGLWIAAGHGPWGISTGPGSAGLLVDLMTGAASAPPSDLDPARFGAPPAAGR